MVLVINIILVIQMVIMMLIMPKKNPQDILLLNGVPPSNYGKMLNISKLPTLFLKIPSIVI
jgi:hypothetical protein